MARIAAALFGEDPSLAHRELLHEVLHLILPVESGLLCPSFCIALGVVWVDENVYRTNIEGMPPRLHDHIHHGGMDRSTIRHRPGRVAGCAFFDAKGRDRDCAPLGSATLLTRWTVERKVEKATHR
jgi:hypothetical protein